MKKCWRIPAKQNAAFAAAMEDVLAACHRPCDERKPVFCMDEQPVQLPGEKREPIPMNEHHEKREDNEYVRKGTCSVFMFVEPLGGRRYAEASKRRTREDWAREVRKIVTEEYPQAEKVVPVMDNLNTHTVASLYEAFPPREAFEIAQRLEIRYTPKHGSRLNIAEIELSAMTSQCLNRRIDTLDKLNREVTAWQNDRNRNQKTVKWQFTADDARIKLHGLYPVI
ncbi:MAG: IS630 family transposase [Spirochaetaceae bacterium]|nr:IS630 family transposase [Spirochaetaceae bacterium]